MSEQMPTLPYSVKLIQTAKGIRIEVHVYGQNDQVAKEAVYVLEETETRLREAHYTIAPVESK
jgi:hypothetical protein